MSSRSVAAQSAICIRESGAADPITGNCQIEPAGIEGEGRKPRTDTKQARLITMLQAPQGASVEEIVAAFSWQPHTVRSALAAHRRLLSDTKPAYVGTTFIETTYTTPSNGIPLPLTWSAATRYVLTSRKDRRVP